VITYHDLFGPAPARPRAKPVLHEAAALKEVMLALKVHPAVAWFERMNSGGFVKGGRLIRFGFPGCPDILGQLRDGRVLAVEVKAPKGQQTDLQRAFLARVRAHGGVGFVARNLVDVRRALA
jgi:hypothetical protein